MFLNTTCAAFLQSSQPYTHKDSLEGMNYRRQAQVVYRNLIIRNAMQFVSTHRKIKGDLKIHICIIVYVQANTYEGILQSIVSQTIFNHICIYLRTRIIEQLRQLIGLWSYSAGDQRYDTKDKKLKRPIYNSTNVCRKVIPFSVNVIPTLLCL